jgi:hypothetical protein
LGGIEAHGKIKKRMGLPWRRWTRTSCLKIAAGTPGLRGFREPKRELRPAMSARFQQHTKVFQLNQLALHRLP